MSWLWALLELLATTSAKLINEHRKGASQEDLIAIANEGAAAQAVLLAEQQRVLHEAADAVPGFVP